MESEEAQELNNIDRIKLNRMKVIKGLEEAGQAIAQHVPPRYLGYSLRAIQDACMLMKSQGADYEAWAKEIGVHVCATCLRADCDCPIENDYTLPKDGYCHLWEGDKHEADTEHAGD